MSKPKRTRREAQLQAPAHPPLMANALANIYERLLKRRAERLAREVTGE